MKRKLLAVALPVMLISGVGCSKDNAEKKKTDSLQVAVDYKTSILDLSKALESKLSIEELKELLMNAKV
ncbi:hypothetical protein CN568_18500 [Bacillus pseudomycoides]|uniref:hypothetical protein n=1 Tax=Bacillus pseudomycoides TaxID=64104 RepID=UPI000BF147AB|nr:hypothetical protein [Bacillus pseudomycoides]PEK22828.1 hypothetical protein CN691_24670 [Bacillus pseudomycoides]PEK67837.1 hypothetical protein CN593_14300 [Bacillus pseudomycoides]PEP39309.1 hypothetical protein CN565_23085 [Bacillus pseudomycoides]PEP42595.1 hypothetical protein CN568_18500 [Bacillus pseudomycoides]PFX50089.1 hypothetical protein COL31_17705 [Bacillus pseudomycoides]